MSTAVSPVSFACRSAATRTMKNSSRFDAAMAANFNRSRRGVDRIACLRQDAFVEREPRLFAVDEQGRGGLLNHDAAPCT